MSEANVGDSIRDTEWDQKYFSLILKLEEKHASRYEMQASKLLLEKSMEILVNGIPITYKLDRLGCSYFIHDGKNLNHQEGWSRIGWSKSAKRKALPHLFAKSEADLLTDLNY
jgi:hypothetical protein